MKPVKYGIFFFGIAVLAALAVYAGVHNVVRTLARLGWGGFSLITGLHLLVIAAMGVAWWSVGRDGLSKFLMARWVRDSVAEVLPFSQIGGYFSGARAASLGGTPLTRSALSMLADLVSEFAAKLVYVLAAIVCLASLLPGAYLIWPMMGMLGLAFAGFLFAAVFRERLKKILEHWAPRLVGRWIPLRAGTKLDFGDYFQWDRLCPSFLIHLACWFFGALEAWVTLRLMGIPVTGGEALVIDSLATSLRALGFMVPAAIGVQEGGYVLVCLLFGIAPAEAVAFSLARRARDLAIGLPGLGLWQFLEAKAFRNPVEQN
ncbi:MAG: lysylphosphatidylglycerol synthase domain-containing protein [Rhizomicrobium sp.]